MALALRKAQKDNDAVYLERVCALPACATPSAAGPHVCRSLPCTACDWPSPPRLARTRTGAAVCRPAAHHGRVPCEGRAAGQP